MGVSTSELKIQGLEKEFPESEGGRFHRERTKRNLRRRELDPFAVLDSDRRKNKLATVALRMRGDQRPSGWNLSSRP